MAYQVEQLKLNFGKRDESMEALVLEWLAQPAVADEPYLAAWQRLTLASRSLCRQLEWPIIRPQSEPHPAPLIGGSGSVIKLSG